LLIFAEPGSTVFLTLAGISSFLFLIGILNMYRPLVNHTDYYWLVTIGYFGLPFGLFFSYIWHQTTYLPSFWIMLIFLIWMSDTFAYLVGSMIGKNKLMPTVSPGKTWEGFIGSGILTVSIAWWLAAYFHPPIPENKSIPGFWVYIAVLVWLFGTLGDLVESSIKRTFNKKDSGNVLPGHGGILDRFDSFIYILPFILFLLSLLAGF
jgi:phosphatidate cytidylyltransferase